MSGLSAENIFNLVNRFSAEEDQVSASFGFVLKANLDALTALLQKLEIDVSQLSSSQLKRIEIDTQVTYPAAKSRIDLRIGLAGVFLILFESKLGTSPVSRDQFVKYGRVLREEGTHYKSLRLVLVTQFDRTQDFLRLRKQLSLSNSELVYLRWEDVRRMVAAHSGNATVKLIIKLFLKYLGDTMGDRKIIAEQKLKDLKQVLIQATDPDWWEFVKKRRLACQHGRAPEALFVAFYRTDKHAVTHIAEVESTEIEEPRKTYRGFPNILRKARQRGWIDTPHKIYHLKEIIELPRWIEKQPEDAPVRNMWLKPMSRLLKARTLGELKGRGG